VGGCARAPLPPLLPSLPPLPNKSLGIDIRATPWGPWLTLDFWWAALLRCQLRPLDFLHECHGAHWHQPSVLCHVGCDLSISLSLSLSLFLSLCLPLFFAVSRRASLWRAHSMGFVSACFSAHTRTQTANSPCRLCSSQRVALARLRCCEPQRAPPRIHCRTHSHTQLLHNILV